VRSGDELIITLRERLHINEEGLAEGARFIPSPNCDERPAGCAAELLVIHAISLPPGEFGGPGIEELFTNRIDPAAHPYYAAIRDLRVSAHFLIRRDGELVQFVPCGKRAWHAGESSWKGRPRCNDYSIGVELEGSGEAAFTDSQYERLAELTRALKARHPIADIAAHSEVAPGRKHDPGPRFDWKRYRAMLGNNRRHARAARKSKKTELSPPRTQRTRRKTKGKLQRSKSTSG